MTDDRSLSIARHLADLFETMPDAVSDNETKAAWCRRKARLFDRIASQSLSGDRTDAKRCADAARTMARSYESTESDAPTTGGWL